MFLPCLPAGCTNSCSDELPAVVAKQGFKGALTMPRVLNFDPLTKTLRAYPDEAMHKLRGKQVSASTLNLALAYVQPCYTACAKSCAGTISVHTNTELTVHAGT